MFPAGRVPPVTRLTLLVVVAGCVVLAGCTAGVPGTDDGPTDDPDTDTPTPSVDCEELDPRDAPERPSNLTRDSAVAFLESHAAATRWNEQYAGEEWVRVDVEASGFVVNRTDSGYVVHVGTRASGLTCDGAYMDPPQYGPGSDYFINGSLLAVNDTGVGVRNASVHQPVSAAEVLRNGTTIERWNETG
jgi:hypothetical protein